MFVFEVVIAAYMHNLEGLDQGSAKEDCLVAIGSMTFLNEPCRHVRSDEALLVGDEVVGAIPDLQLLLGLLHDLTDLFRCPLTRLHVSSFNHPYFTLLFVLLVYFVLFMILIFSTSVN